MDYGLAKPVKEFLSTGCAERASQLACLEDVADLNVREVLKRMATPTCNEEDITSLNCEARSAQPVDRNSFTGFAKP